MKHLSIDIETYSSVDIGKTGAYRYAQAEDFEILLFAYMEDDKPVQVVDLASGEEIPSRIKDELTNPAVTKHAYNAAFEWYCLNRYEDHWDGRVKNYFTPIEQWQCTMIHGLYAGYPAGLGAIGSAIGIDQDKQKLKTGKALIKYFCEPCKPTRANGNRTRNLPHHDPEKWALFKDYCAQDVVAEHAIERRLQWFPVPDAVWREWRQDIAINARGVCVDEMLIQGARHLDEVASAKLMDEAKILTGLSNPKSNPQLLAWLNDNLKETVEDVKKETVQALLDRGDLPEMVRRVLQIRQQLGKTSVTKYNAMEVAKGEDGRIRGLLQFYGASRTGRWAGRLVQVQNLPRNYLGTLDMARKLVKAGNYDGVQLVYGNVPDTLSQLIRTAFTPSDGNKLIVSDFSAIEARVIAWLAGEKWVEKVFRDGGDIYCATASQMFGVPVEKHGQNADLRQKGKVATLALGYQGGPGALIAMGALKMGIEEGELPDIVQKWRNANPHIENLWYAIENAAIKCLETGKTQKPILKTYDPERARENEDLNGADRGAYSEWFLYDVPASRIMFRLEGDVATGMLAMTVELPSGRKLYYVSPHLAPNKFGKPAIHYKGVNQTNKKWEDNETYGGKLTENIVQAVARDCLAVTLDRVIEAGYKPVMHIHDEIVIDATPDQRLEDVNEIFAQPISWAPGLLLSGAGFESEYYMKD